MKLITHTAAWQMLQKHYDTTRQHDMRKSPASHHENRVTAGGMTLDYTRHLATPETFHLLFALANEANLSAEAKALFSGGIVNNTEHRPALHTALRDFSGKPIYVDGKDIMPDIQVSRHRLSEFVTQLHQGKLTGVTKKPFRHIVNIGIGGSHTGPLMTTEALKDYAVNALRFHFISTVDPSIIEDTLAEIDPETTLFIISSKSFATIETLTNAKYIISWLQSRLNTKNIEQHLVAVTARKDRAQAFGIPENNIFTLWDWVGGRYSIWSAIGLPLMLMIGTKQFDQFLQGAYEMDSHFLTTPLSDNMPVILALLGIWYTSFFKASVHAVIPYAYRLRSLIPYLQQAIMESNGKCVTKSGDMLNCPTSPVIFGQEGCEGQHTYHQLLHQGTNLIPADFIIIKKSHAAKNQSQQQLLIASALSQAEALRIGDHQTASPHHAIPGNRPCSLLILDKLTPASLGALIALYEHMIFTQGIIWGINSYDQWGVELGKSLLPAMLKQLSQSEHSL